MKKLLESAAMFVIIVAVAFGLYGSGGFVLASYIIQHWKG